jgi:translin
MTRLEELVGKVHRDFEARHQVREKALKLARTLTMRSAHAIRAIHRGEVDLAEENMREARSIVDELRKSVEPDPEIYYSGYTQDAIKEFVEARLTINMIQDNPLALPEELGVDYAPYMNGLAETIGELRRRCLDILRHGYSDDAERLLDLMDEIYSLLVTVDYPDAITHGLRRQTDLVRGIIERTRADITTSLGEQRLQRSLKEFKERITGNDQG